MVVDFGVGTNRLGGAGMCELAFPCDWSLHYWASTLQMSSSLIVSGTIATSGYSPVPAFQPCGCALYIPGTLESAHRYTCCSFELLLCVTFVQEIALIQRTQWLVTFCPGTSGIRTSVFCCKSMILLFVSPWKMRCCQLHSLWYLPVTFVVIPVASWYIYPTCCILVYISQIVSKTNSSNLCLLYHTNSNNLLFLIKFQ